MRQKTQWVLVLAVCLAALGGAASAQTIETVGGRALGMGGAFVAVASDASATWWNPAALAAGPFVDVSLGWGTSDTQDPEPGWRERTWGVTLMTPPAGVSVYRFRVTDIASIDTTDESAENREKRRVGVPARTLAASQVGVTLVHSVADGIHVGTTLKYLRGNSDNAFDVDVGALAVTGAMRVGLLLRHMSRPGFGDGPSRWRLPRQARVGIAFDGEAAGMSPFIVSMDADVTRIETPAGDRRIVALGVERWLRARRIGIRGGARFNTAGRHERVATAGASVAVRSGLYLEAYGARGGASDDQGWGLGARVTF